MSAPPYIPFFVEDYIGDTIGLSLDEHGAYFLLILAAWKQEDCALPDDDRKLARICRVSPQKWKRLRAVMLDFWTIENGRWCNSRLKKERVYVEKKSLIARNKANKRWDAQPSENIESGPCSSNAVADATADAAAYAPYTPHLYVEPNGSTPASETGSPPIDMVKAIFDSGIFILQRGGKTERQARSLIGGWRKQYHDSVVLTVLAEAQARGPSEPVSWIAEHLRIETSKAAGVAPNGTGTRNNSPVDHDQAAWERRRVEAGGAAQSARATEQ